MITLTALLLDRCGLSHREAAAFLGVRLDTVASWSSGRNPTPPGVIAELRGLYARIEQAAARTIADVCPEPATILAPLADNDAEAQALGWPCVGAQRAMLGIVAARLDADVPVRVVERGRA